MDKFLQKLIRVGVIVSLIATGIMAVQSETSMAQAPPAPSPAEPIPVPLEYHQYCMQWAASAWNYKEGGVTPAAAYNWCVENTQMAIEAKKADYDLNVILKRGKQVLPVASPYAPNFPAVPGTEGADPAQGIPELVAFVYTVGLWLVGAAAFMQITLGGVQWLLAAGKPGQIEKAKSRITNAIFGLILLLSSYVILNTINPDLVNSVFEPPAIGTGGLPHR
jgi:hypothetical protein